MNRFNAMQDTINSRTKPFLSFIGRDPVNIVLTLLLVMYAGNFVPKLPKQLDPLFENTAFRVFFLALAVYLRGIDAGMSVLLGLAAYATFVNMRGRNTLEAFEG